MKTVQSHFIKEIKKNGGLFLLAIPPVLYVIIFNYIPLYGLILPFKNFNYSLGFFKSPWSGFQNFRFLFESNDLLLATRNTVLYNILFILVGTFICIALALMLFELSRRATKIYQTVMFFPYFVSWVVASYVFLSFLDTDNGVINRILEHFGKEPVMWYGQVKYWPFFILIAALWKGTGYTSVIYYAGLMGIDGDIYEAAKIDGASKLQQIRTISIPMLSPLITVMVILQIGKIFYSDFGLFYNIPLDSSLLYPVTDVIDVYVYRSLKSLGDIGMASAAGLYQALVGFILVMLTNFAVKKINIENSLF